MAQMGDAFEMLGAGGGSAILKGVNAEEKRKKAWDETNGL